MAISVSESWNAFWDCLLPFPPLFLSCLLSFLVSSKILKYLESGLVLYCQLVLVWFYWRTSLLYFFSMLLYFFFYVFGLFVCFVTIKHKCGSETERSFSRSCLDIDVLCQTKAGWVFFQPGMPLESCVLHLACKSLYFLHGFSAISEDGILNLNSVQILSNLV